MFKIIYLSYVIGDSYYKELKVLPQKFNTYEEAKTFILKTDIPREFNEVMGNENPENVSYTIEEYDNINKIFLNLYYYDKKLTCIEYLITEV